MACIRLARLRGAIALACCAALLPAARSHGRTLYVDDADGTFRDMGVVVRAEEVSHKGERMLLVRFDALPPPWQGIGPAPAFAPVEIACDRVTAHTEGRTQAIHAASPCGVAGRLGHAKAIPVFVAFTFPAPAREARLTVPLTIAAPPPPVPATLREATRVRPPPAPPQERVVTVRIDLGNRN